MKNKLILQALVGRFRFQSSNGNINLEDLAQLPLSKLNDVAKELYIEAQKSTISFIEPRSVDSESVIKLEIVKEIIAYRQESALLEINEKKSNAEIEELDLLISEKQKSGATIEELVARRAAL